MVLVHHCLPLGGVVELSYYLLEVLLVGIRENNLDDRKQVATVTSFSSYELLADELVQVEGGLVLHPQSSVSPFDYH